jgi:hypothetical protein
VSELLPKKPPRLSEPLQVLLSFCALPFVVIKVALFTLFYLIPSLVLDSLRNRSSGN